MAASPSLARRVSSVASDDPLVRSFALHLRAANKRPATIEHYVGAVRQFLAFCRAENLPVLTEVSREHVELWLVRLHETYKPHSVKNRFVGVRIFFKWLREEDEIARDPTVRIPMPKVDEVEKDVVDPEDMTAIFLGLEKRKRWRDAALVAILYDTGLRASEVAECLEENVNLDTGIIFVPKTKARRTRVVRLSAAGIRYLDRYLRTKEGKREHAGAIRPEPEYLLNGVRGQLTRSGIYQIIREICEQAGVKGTIGPHDLRHTSATHAATEMSERDMMTLFGWSDSEMARHYARKALESAALAAHEKASPLMRLRLKK